MQLRKLLSAICGFVLNSVAALVGPLPAESAFHRFLHASTISSLYIRELIMTGVLDLMIGGLVYYKWRSATAKWTWVAGLCGLLWHLGFHRGSFTSTYDTVTWMTLDWLSVRTIAYSVGALFCEAVLAGSEP